jgi:hypothetical protein
MRRRARTGAPSSARAGQARPGVIHPERDALLAVLIGRARVGLDAQDPRFGALYRLQRVAKQVQEDAVEMIRIGAHGQDLVHALLPVRRTRRGEGVAGRVDERVSNLEVGVQVIPFLPCDCAPLWIGTTATHSVFSYPERRLNMPRTSSWVYLSMSFVSLATKMGLCDSPTSA